MVLPTYSHRGPKKKCRCGLQLVADDDECDECQRNDQVFATLEVLPLEESTPVPKTLVRKLDQSQQQQLDRLLENNKGLFYREGDLLPQTDVVEHCIDTGDATPIKQRFYRTSQVEQTFIENEIRRMLVDGLIREAQGPWASPVVLVKKKNGKLRFCVDYRKLNTVTKKDAYPLPRIDDVFDSLTHACWFSSLDLASGYWQVRVREEDREKTAFITKLGTFEFNVMPFGLTNAPAAFQRLMDRVLKEAIGRFVLVYIDDINIYSRTFEEHLRHLQWVLDKLREANLGCRKEKCEFVRQQLKFLGHVISADGLAPDPDKVAKVQNFQHPQSVHVLRSFLGLASYYRKFVRDFSKKAAPLYNLLKKKVAYQWTSKQEQAFQTLKNALTSASILVYPDFDRLFVLHTDASKVGLGAVLAQQDKEKHEHVVSYASRAMNNAETNYSTTVLTFTKDNLIW